MSKSLRLRRTSRTRPSRFNIVRKPSTEALAKPSRLRQSGWITVLANQMAAGKPGRCCRKFRDRQIVARAMCRRNFISPSRRRGSVDGRQSVISPVVPSGSRTHRELVAESGCGVVRTGRPRTTIGMRSACRARLPLSTEIVLRGEVRPRDRLGRKRIAECLRGVKCHDVSGENMIGRYQWSTASVVDVRVDTAAPRLSGRSWRTRHKPGCRNSRTYQKCPARVYDHARSRQ